MNKRLLVTSTDLMMVQFLLPHIKYLRENGFEVDVGCSDVGGRIDEVKQALGENTVTIIRLVRNPFDKTNLTGLKDLRTILKQKHYDLIWTNEPVMGLMTRLAAKETRKNGTKVIYMTHGYHFFKGCPSKYKLIYPIEKYASRLCDAIVTINWEDYDTTLKSFHTKKVFHIDGIGLDTSKFRPQSDRLVKRVELGIPSDSFVVISVGELKPHKDHMTVLKAIAQVNNTNVHYVVCGQGELRNQLESVANSLNVADRIHLLGYRHDISELLNCSDVFAFPSVREGLGLASLEAMAAGLPIVGSDTRGIRDYIENEKTGYLCIPGDPTSFASAILKCMNDKRRQLMSDECKKAVEKYDIGKIQTEILSIMNGCISGENYGK